jgi:hypothetical protein
MPPNTSRSRSGEDHALISFSTRKENLQAMHRCILMWLSWSVHRHCSPGNGISTSTACRRRDQHSRDRRDKRQRISMIPSEIILSSSPSASLKRESQWAFLTEANLIMIGNRASMRAILIRPQAILRSRPKQAAILTRKGLRPGPVVKMPTKQYAEATDTADGFPRIREIGSDIRLLWHRKDSIMNTEPLIVGAGPTGLSAALFLADRGIHSRVIDKALGLSTTSRAQVINPRTLELLDPLA